MKQFLRENEGSEVSKQKANATCKQDGWPIEGQSTPGRGGYFPYQDWEKDPEEIKHH
jgi:hypothetical protein